MRSRLTGHGELKDRDTFRRSGSLAAPSFPHPARRFNDAGARAALFRRLDGNIPPRFLEEVADDKCEQKSHADPTRLGREEVIREPRRAGRHPTQSPGEQHDG